MSRKLLLLMLLALLIGTLNLASSVEKAKASGTIYIRADGSVEGTNKIQRDGDAYIFSGNVDSSVTIERSRIIINGNGYMVRGMGTGYGFYFDSVSNVTISNANIENFSRVYIFSIRISVA